MKFWAISLAVLLLGGTAVLVAVPKAQSGVPSPTEKAKVLVQEIKPTDDTRRLLVPVKVEARLASLVTAEVEGLVTHIKKPLGSRVRAGEVVLYVENKDPAFTYAKVAVRAPIAGVVSQISPTLMSRVSRGDRLFVVMDPKELKLSAEIPAADLGIVQPGTKGIFKLSLDDKDGTAIRVTGLSPLVDPRTGTASAELEFAPVKGAVLPAIGMVGHALFETSRGKVLLIPEAALGYSDGKPTVKVLDKNGNVKKKPVELGEQKESQLVVTKGLDAGDKLIVRANRAVKDGENVDVETDTKPN
ncbi:MAG: efflux RND transporter periplasmic adaptor subunit [Bdellovibrionota bacterium]